jgi:hypothetical protein
MIKIHQKDNRNHITGVKPPIVTLKIAVITPIKKKIISGHSRIS